MTRGLIRRRASYPKPRRSIAPGPKFSATTSARPTIRSKMARPRSVFRSSVTLFLLALRRRKNQRSEEHTSELQSRLHLVCRLLLEKKKKPTKVAADGRNVYYV